MRVLSIQSSVAYGHAGNSAATFPLQRLGHEVWPVNTVHFSNHTGYGSFRGVVFDPADVAEVVRGVGERGAFPRTDMVLTGYPGSAGVIEVILSAVAAVRAAHPGARYCCDPVMGDAAQGMYVAADIPGLLRSRVVPAADIVCPNAFELAYLAGSGGPAATAVPADVRTIPALLEAAATVRSMGPETVLVTSVEDGRAVQPVAGGCDGPGDTGEFFGVGEVPGDADSVSMIAVDSTGAYRVSTPRLPLAVNGAGDVTAALFAAHLATGDIRQALAATASSVHAILTETLRQATLAGAATAELALIEAQEHIAAPRCEFGVTDVHSLR